MIFLEIIAGLIPAIPAFYLTRTMSLRLKPVKVITRTTQAARILESATQLQLEREGKSKPKEITSSTPTKAETTVMEENYTKWANNKAEIPFIKDTINVLKKLATCPTTQLSIEETHNLEVLSNQTETLLSNWYDTPEQVRELPQVGDAFREQLTKIEEAVNDITLHTSEGIVRELKLGTKFITEKFKK